MFSPKARFFLVLPLLLSLAQQLCAFSLNGYHWPTGTEINMHLNLTRPPVNFQDGSASWSASAADALTIWNQYVNGVHFVAGPPVVPAAEDDEINNVFFSTSIYNEGFPAHVLAITLYYSRTGNDVFSETDVIFNNALQWDSYRGPLQHSGSVYTFDFHRVALHEFGHVLGLDHPDEHGQTVVAVMNSVTSDLDHVADDDIAGASSLYGFRITSSLNPPAIQSGNQFTYQITASNNPTIFGATGLPPGMQINTATGLISGSCPSSGAFPVDVTAQGASGVATGRVAIVINPLPITSNLFPAQVLIGNSFAYQIQAGNNPTSFSASGLPPGLSIDPATGIISGISTASGTFLVTVRAQGPLSVAQGIVQIVIVPPRITSSLSVTAELGGSFSYQIAATHNPSGFAATSLPSGLQINPSTGLITGTLNSAGNFFVTVIAHTSFGDATGTLRISVPAPRITSPATIPDVFIGSQVDYQITASHQPTSFAATGLPAGLSVDGITGRISGVTELSGYYQFQVVAHCALGDAVGTLSIHVTPLSSVITDQPPTIMPLNIRGSIVADPVRSRIYVLTDVGVAVIDSESLTVLQTIPVGGITQGDLSVSLDGSRLWVVGISTNTIRSLDLNTLAVSPELSASQSPKHVREGADGYLYVSDYHLPGVFQIDPNTGETRARFGDNSTATAMGMSRDGKNLYLTESNSGFFVSRYRLASGVAPALVQRSQINVLPDALVLSPNGQSLALLPGNVDSQTVFRSTADLNVLQGSLYSGFFPTELKFSSDGTFAFQTTSGSSQIDAFLTATRQLVRTRTLPGGANVTNIGYGLSAMALNRDSSRIFIAGVTSSAPYQTALYVYTLTSPVEPPRPPRILLNVSTRLRAQTGDNVLIGGFILTGTEPKKVIMRAIGPSLPLAGKLADPTLELHASNGTLLSGNDNWNAHRNDVLNSNIPPTDEHESAIVETLAPGAYTVILRGVAQTSGVALVEIYDLNPQSASRLANLSTRGKVETGDNVMIGGFIIGGDQPTRVIVRAIGPSLGAQGVTGALGDTTLDLHDANGNRFASNDNWQSDQAAEIIAAGLAPTDVRESATAQTLPPGSYTAIVRGANNAAGIALVEIYNLETN